MRRRNVLIGLVVPGGWAGPVAAQLPAASDRVVRVGWVAMRSGDTPGSFEAFRDGLRDRGWFEGRNLSFELRAGERADASRLYDELRQAGVQVIAATGAIGWDIGLLARDVPVIFVIGGDPVDAGLVTSMARPQGNRTGMTMLSYELIGKRLELVRQVLPGLQRVGYMFYEPHPGAKEELRQASVAATAMGLTLRPLPLNGNADVGPALQHLEREGLQAVLTATDSLIGRHAARIAASAAAVGVPVVSGWSVHVDNGFLLSYGAGMRSFYHYLASYVDRTLHGVRVADMPVETPPKVELVINRRTARAIGLTLPPALLARADAFVDGPA